MLITLNLSKLKFIYLFFIKYMLTLKSLKIEKFYKNIFFYFLLLLSTT